MNHYDLLLVNPPSLIDKPDIGYGGGVLAHTEISEKLKVKAMNPGLLSITSYILSKNYSVKLVDLSLSNNYDELNQELTSNKFRFAGVSSTSGFDYNESLKCLEIIKQTDKQIVSLIGGQHAGALGSLAFSDTPNLDVLCMYEGESVVEQILQGNPLKSIDGIIFKKEGGIIVKSNYPKIIPLDDLPSLNFKAYPNFIKFAPFIEESRGCFSKCYYCTSEYINNGKLRRKSVNNILEQTKAAINLWGKDPIYILAASTFGSDVKHMRELSSGLKDLGIKWTAEFRADSKWYEHMDELVESGLSVAVVGLENASPEILLRMGKTKNPDKYLNSMQNIISEKKKFGDLVLRLNMMFYLGETPKTIKDNISFLSENADGIDAILYTPVFINPGTKIFNSFNEFENEFGAKLLQSEFWDRRHLHICHPSKYFSFEESLSFCDIMEKIFSTERGWFESEKFHYVKDQVSDQEILEERFSRRELI